MEDADIIARAVALLLQRRDEEAKVALAAFPAEDPIPIPTSPAVVGMSLAEIAKAEPLNNSIRVKVYERDGWRCRYCDRKIVLPPVLDLLGVLCPGFKGLLPGHHMPAGTEPAIERVYPNVDHIHPVSKSGSWRDGENHVTACTPCNTRKSDRLGWMPNPPFRDDWDGLTRSYRALSERAVSLTSYQRGWLKVVDLTTPPKGDVPSAEPAPSCFTGTAATPEVYHYIVTDRGGSRSYATLVSVNGPDDGNLYLRAQRKAARVSSDIRDCGIEISAFRLTKVKFAKWLDIERRLSLIPDVPENLEQIRSIQEERHRFLERL